MSPFDVAIVGLGAMGSAAAWHLARQGVRVLGLDRYAPPHHLGSTHGHSRIIREAYFEHPLYVPFVRRAYDLWRTIVEDTGADLLLQTGGLMIGPQAGRLITGARESARLHALPCELWSGDELRQRVPAFDVGDDVSALWEPRAGLLRPERAITALLASARRRGAELVYDTTVTGWRRDGDGILLATPACDYRAARVVLAAGAWLSDLLAPIALPLVVERAVQVWVRPARSPELFAPDRLPVFLVEYAPERVFYGLPDEGHGVKVARHHDGESTTAETARRLVDEDERRSIHALAAEWLPNLRGPILDATVCLYTNTPDEHFVIDWHPRDDRVVIVSACSGHGFKFAPAIGEAVADLVSGVRPRADLAPFRATRFGAI
jgi:sarcosine oxidase